MYSLIYTFFTVLTAPFLLVRASNRTKYLANFKARLGLQEYPSRDKPVIWIHAVSVGETLAVRGLVLALKERYPDHAVWVSTTTLMGANMARGQLAADGHFFFPYDWRFACRKVLRRVKPALCILVESEFWPNFIRVTHREQVPMILVNGRVSDRSYPRYRKFGILFRPLLEKFSLLGAQSRLDAKRLIAMGAPRDKVMVTGNLKNHPDQFVVNPEMLAMLEGVFGKDSERPWFIAGSTHEGEEEIVWDAFEKARAKHPNLRLAIAPRKPQRFAKVARMLEKKGVPFERYTDLTGKTATASVVLVDTVGILMALYRLGFVAFVGGSIVKKGGHNLLEVCAAGIPVLFGKHMFNFRSVREDVLRNDAGIKVRDAKSMAAALNELLDDEQSYRRRCLGAGSVIATSGAALPVTLQMVDRVMEGEAAG
jgi:3-deoxy-D-manno-octulosonic-acid transferase